MWGRIRGEHCDFCGPEGSWRHLVANVLLDVALFMVGGAATLLLLPVPPLFAVFAGVSAVVLWVTVAAAVGRRLRG